jgi:hypothetical protein
MENLVIFCKTYINDLERLRSLKDSIEKFNIDSIPFIVSVPKEDMTMFKKEFTDITFIEDESIHTKNESGWLNQQIVKSNFWKLGICENYLCIDADSQFIKQFTIKDFMYDETTPYTVMHEQRELFSWLSYRPNILPFNPKDSFIKDRKNIMDVFSRVGKYYDFGPTPVIWSSKVWKDLHEHYLQPNQLDFIDLLHHSPSELSWYGESLLAFNSIPIYPSEPLFKVYHYKQQFEEDEKFGITDEILSQNYLGKVIQSNWN